jgi:glutamine synthetase
LGNGGLDMNVDGLRSLASSGELDTIVLAATDFQGRLFGKRMTADFLLDSQPAGTFASVAALAGDIDLEVVPGLTFGGPGGSVQDILLRPDYSTARLVPWYERTALVLADITTHEGDELLTTPRSVLKTQLRKARAMGLEIFTGSELEFYLFRETPESAREKGYRDLRSITESRADYSLLRSSREEWFWQLLRNQLKAGGIPVEGSKAEYGPGQMEVNLLHSDALEMADRHAIFKHAVKEISQAHGFLATFMAKPFSDKPGSGGHIHVSVRDPQTGGNLFWNEQEKGPSALLTSFLAGVQTLAPASSLMYAPYVNSYKRYVAGSYAPRANTAGQDDRTAAFRLTGEGQSLRIENRLPGADVNPYLGMAAMVAAGLHGVERRLSEPEAAGQTLPENLVEAVEALEASGLFRELLSAELANDLAGFAKAELARYFREVTDWERQAYLEQA